MYRPMTTEAADAAERRCVEKMRTAEEVFPARMREIRKKMKISQSQLAEVTHIDYGSISMYERGRRMPTFANLAALSAVLNVSVGWLIGEV